MSEDSRALLLILGMAVTTYLTRIGGHLVLSRFPHLNPRIEAALDAVPAAVLAAIVAPMAMAAGTAELLASIAVAIASVRLPIIPVLVLGVVLVLALRAAGL